MQPEQNQNQEWQQPRESMSQAPYESASESQYEDDIADGQTMDDEDVAERSEDDATQDDTALLRWEGTEYLHQERSALWYIVAAVVATLFVVVALVWFRSITFAILVPVMLAALVVYVRRPPATLHYVLSRKGLHIDDRLFAYSQFKSFGVLSHAGQHSVVLVPRKRFQIGQTIFFPEEVGEQLVDMLAARLPMKEVSPDLIDRLLSRIHL